MLDLLLELDLLLDDLLLDDLLLDDLPDEPLLDLQHEWPLLDPLPPLRLLPLPRPLPRPRPFLCPRPLPRPFLFELDELELLPELLESDLESSYFSGTTAFLTALIAYGLVRFTRLIYSSFCWCTTG